ncbi:Vacuolar protein sorting-associated protein 11 [Nowakowskiella sp. JEL0407]|nr:Vacuolar protein sorting-associated protein 11 [Nowakowskiella sp. JEL0407]
METESHTFFAAKATNTNTPSNETVKQYLSNLLEHIDSHEILLPLQVLQVLMRNPLVTVGMVRDYIINRVQNEKTALSSDERAIKGYKEDTKRMKAMTQELQSSVVIVQASKCNFCNQGLELPSVHFACKHSFHQRCLSNDSVCPKCVTEHRAVQEIVKSQEAAAGKSDVFLQKLEKEKDRFSVISEYFSKNTFMTVMQID